MHRRLFSFSVVMLLLFAASCAQTPPPPASPQKPPKRLAWVTGLNPEKAAYYRELHAKPWPGVNKMIKECHIQNFSIHQKEIDGKQYLFAYLEYTGDDLDADMKKMAADPETQRWWKRDGPLPSSAARRREERQDLGRRRRSVFFAVSDARSDCARFFMLPSYPFQSHSPNGCGNFFNFRKSEIDVESIVVGSSQHRLEVSCHLRNDLCSADCTCVNRCIFTNSEFVADQTEEPWGEEIETLSMDSLGDIECIPDGRWFSG